MAADKEKKRGFWLILMIISGVLLAVSAAVLLWYFLPALTRHVVPPDSSGTLSAPESAAPVVLPENPIDFAALQAQNSDIVGWIRVPGTVIDYPILQSSKDEVEDFYLYRNVEKAYKRAGSIYIQKMNDPAFTDPNTVIYGHYMANGTMFADLHQFRKEAFFNQYDTAYIYTPGHILTYRIYSAFVYDNRHVLNSFDFQTEEGFEAFLEDTRNPRSMARRVREGVEVTTKDRIISLCTCTMKESERYLVEGVLIDDQPTR